MLKGKCAVITGSTAGQGALMAAALAAQGCNIVLNGLGDPAAIENQRATLERETGVDVSYHPADLSVEEQVASLIAFALERHGAVDILINNAVVRHFAPVEEFESAHWTQELAVNLSSAFYAIRAALPGMRAKGWGRIINLSSNHGLFGAANRVGYVTTKTALIGLTRAVAMETVGTQITCNAICPSAMLGINSQTKIDDLMKREQISREAATAKFLSERKTTRFVETLPAVVLFLCSEAGRDMTGVALPVDLGSTAGRPSSL
ncbi:SDR family NAD(P)-dependent oxidoreductase [Pigmentiphaga sp. H8]|uniref:SDR family NAD(P)-dependent oxidoreductase n=1 Tax=Pigmentiphaga sp. H8 TaxID=2488560 RepID=UPI000F59007C|nr:SDR family NAD(P)-dependent oxidoreductase [Pigmentiphaga sp. H8]AZG08218.1 SDR family NAD(P)-dependent oxidoreductase [Pigmentiphaga sp. H8]